MTQEKEIIEMARQAGFERLDHTDNDWVCNPEDIEAFAKLVDAKATAREREDIWKMACDYTQRSGSHVCLALADAIRARGKA